MRSIWKLPVIIMTLMALVLACPANAWADTDDICPNSENGEHVWVDVGWPATCTEDGIDYWQCQYCYKEKAEPVTLPALGHDYIAEEMTPATCESSGVMMYTCTRCGDSWRDTIPALGYHSYDSGVVTTAATCETPGVITYTCATCGESYTESIPALGHAWDNGSVTQEATCTEEGIWTYTCTRCGETTTESLPKTGHTIETIPGKEASCWEEGLTDGQKCSVCGEIITWQESIPRLEHAWDEGVLQDTEGGMLHDKSIVYTCTRCGETRTETIKANLQNFFPTLYNDPTEDPTAGSISDQLALLHITKQPQDLELSWQPGNMGTLTIAAEGGTTPYTYRWILMPDIAEKNSILGSSFVDAMNAMGPVFENACDLGTSFGKAEGGHTGTVSADRTDIGSMKDYWEVFGKQLEQAVRANEEDNMKGYELIPANAIITETEIPELQVEVGDADGYTAWCIVFDNKGDYVRSDKVRIIPKLAIISQPKDVNIEDTEAVFSVGAAYGKEPYTYQWQYFSYGPDEFADIEESDAPDAKTQTLKPVRGFNQVRCVVTDDNGQIAISEAANAYSAPVLEVKAVEEVLIRPGEEAELSATFQGGTAPYTATWKRVGGNGAVLETYEIEEDPAGTWYVYPLDSTDSSIYGKYVFTVEDSLGQIKDVTVKVSYRNLTITKQPEDGDLDINGKYDVTIEMGEGMLPYTYTLRDVTHVDIVTETLPSSSWTTTVTESNTIYYIYVTDASGLHAESNYFWVGDHEVKIISQPDEIEILDPHVYTDAHLLISGGEGPYTLTWLKMNEETGAYETIETTEGYTPTVGRGDGCILDLETEDWATLGTVRTGTFMLEATDTHQVKGVSKPFRAVYKGSVPYITVQPQGAEYAAEAGRGRSNLSYTLDCLAETATGDYVTYLWEYLDESGNWKTLPLQTMYARDPSLHGAGWADYPHQEFRRVDESRLYRCKVTNNRTGEYNYSDTAFVKIIMQCTASGQSGKDTALYAEFIGGAWPYTFQLRQIFPPADIKAVGLVGTDGNNHDYTAESFIEYPQEEMYMNHWYKGDDGQMHMHFTIYKTGVPGAVKQVFESNITGGIYCSAEGVARRYRIPYDFNGEETTAGATNYDHRIYQVMIVDRFGDTCTSEWFRMTSPMTAAEKVSNFIFIGIFGYDPGKVRDHTGW